MIIREKKKAPAVIVELEFYNKDAAQRLIEQLNAVRKGEPLNEHEVLFALYAVAETKVWGLDT